MRKSIFVFLMALLVATSGTPVLATYSGDDSSDDDYVTSISLSADGANLKWSVVGESDQGFKVVWSKNSGPTYPTRDGDKYHYYSEDSKRSDTIEAFAGAGTYYVRVCEYLGGKCGVYSNQVKTTLGSGEGIACTMEYNPVCGKDGRTYSNKCMAEAAGTSKSYYGECKKDQTIIEIEDKAKLLDQNQLAEILKELKELRSLVKEQQNELKYLRKLVVGMSNVTDDMRNSLNSFISYGVDDNTKKLGEGERAAVIFSYKEAFGKLPSSEAEFADAIKIANGRYPSEMSEEAESEAKDLFEKIYLREPDMDDSQDRAAVIVMAYGLRQKAENRNLSAERKALAIFRSIFKHAPESSQDWNVVQAIAYSGAGR